MALADGVSSAQFAHRLVSLNDRLAHIYWTQQAS